MDGTYQYRLSMVKSIDERIVVRLLILTFFFKKYSYRFMHLSHLNERQYFFSYSYMLCIFLILQGLEDTEHVCKIDFPAFCQFELELTPWCKHPL